MRICMHSAGANRRTGEGAEVFLLRNRECDRTCSCQCQLLPRWDERQARYLIWKYKGKKDALGSSSKYGVPVKHKHAWEWDDEEEDGAKDDDEAAKIWMERGRRMR
eukprot:scaffold13821_cov72-Skeletonema_dohrnii-CCMP3373.AAC.3